MSNNKWAWIIGIVPLVLKVALMASEAPVTWTLKLAFELAVKY